MWGLLLLCISLAEDCKNSLNDMIENELTPRLQSFSQTGQGFDYLGKYDECQEKPEYRYLLIKNMFNQSVQVLLGTCLPSTCEKTMIEEAVKNSITSHNWQTEFPIDKAEVIFPDLYNEQPLSTPAKFGFFFICLWLAITVCATFTKSPPKKKGCGKKPWLWYFSIRKNFETISSLPKKYDPLQCFNGIRVITAISIMFFHCFIYEFFASVTNRLAQYQSFSSLFINFMVIITLNVDIFFFLSGFLASYLTIPELRKKKADFSWMGFYIRRLIRYTPAYFFVLLVDLVLLKHLANGPQWPLIEQISPFCKEYWWGNLLYLNNVITTVEVPCEVWTWSVAADFQFYLLSPIVLYSYYKNKTAGYMISSLLIVSSIMYTIVVSELYMFNPSFIHGLCNNFQSNMIYFKPFSRVTPFLIGGILGFVYLSKAPKNKKKPVSQAYLHENYGERFENFCLNAAMNKSVRYTMYVIGICMMTGVGLVGYDLDVNGINHWPQYAKSTVVALQRPCFILGFSFWIMPILLGHCQGLRVFLSAKFFAPLAKISYSVYLIHPVVFNYLFLTGKHAFEADLASWVFHTLSVVVCANLVSFLVTLLIETPVLSLEKKYFKR